MFNLSNKYIKMFKIESESTKAKELKLINNVAIFGSSGALGGAFTHQLSALYPQATIHAFSRSAIKSNSGNVFDHLIDYQGI